MHKDYSISWLWRHIVTNKQAQKKQQKTKNIQCDLHTLHVDHALPMDSHPSNVVGNGTASSYFSLEVFS